MLKSETFTGGIRVAPEKSALLLRHIVGITLTGDSLTERALLLDFYGYTAEQLLRTNADIDTARIGVLRLRKKLKAYYENEGLEDGLRIDIPKGQYKADFSVNQSSQARKELKIGYMLVEREAGEDAREYFDKALRLDPELADAWAGIAAARITALYHLNYDDKDGLREAREACQKALALDETCWRAHAEIGAVHLFRHEWELADAAFRKAKQIAPLEISEVASYATFLVSRGYNDDARDLASYLQEQFERPLLQIRAAHIHYGLGECEKADEILDDVEARNGRLWQIHWLKAWVYLQLGEKEDAHERMLDLLQLRYGNGHPALQIFCCEAMGEYDRSKALFETMESLMTGELFGYTREQRIGHFPATADYALGCLAQGDEEQAIKYFSVACDISAPFTAWLHVDPILSPLRKHRSFRELLAKWKYPKPYSGPGRLSAA